MALYHSFDWKQGRAAFEEIARLDPRCGRHSDIWGLAMVAADNPFGWPVSLKLQDGAEAIQQAKEVGAATPRERDYIAALTMLYTDHATVPHRQRARPMQAGHGATSGHLSHYVEAAILYALTVSANHDLNDKTFARPLKAAGLLEPLFGAYPRHPAVAHYLIHSYDYPPIADKGLEAAKRYAEVAPDASHAQHMPSHIISRRCLARIGSLEPGERCCRQRRYALHSARVGLHGLRLPAAGRRRPGPTKWGPRHKPSAR